MEITEETLNTTCPFCTNTQSTCTCFSEVSMEKACSREKGECESCAG